jgi:26S proteasome regulatory subunit N11
MQRCPIRASILLICSTRYAHDKIYSGEVIHISSLALLKVLVVLLIQSLEIFNSCLQMLKHGRAGVPMEVMGLMLGEFVDDYTVQVIDVFAMPQSGTTVSVESVDYVFQTKMVEMLKQTGRCAIVTLVVIKLSS